VRFDRLVAWPAEAAEECHLFSEADRHEISIALRYMRE
jgi:hypothetical protein